MKHICEKCRMEFDTVGECSLHEKECSGMMEFDESVFKRDSCPEWARYAVIEKTGTVVFSSMPMFFSDGEWLIGNVYNRILIDVHGKKIFRKDFGELMLVRNVPEKVKPGDWVYFKGEKKYLQVEDKTGNTSEGFNLRCIDYAPATKIPLTAKELKCLVGKVVQEDTQKRVALVLEYNEDYGVKIGDSWFSAEELLWGVSFLDGKPVATLQHYDEEEGKWVK